MVEFAFPEATQRLPSSKRPLQFKQLVAVVYAFGGVSAAIALLSKFVVMPLFEQLTEDRSTYAREARTRLFDLNLKLQTLVSNVPNMGSLSKGYVDAKTQSSSPTMGKKEPEVLQEEVDWIQFGEVFRSDSPVYDSESERTVSEKIGEFEQYLRGLMYTNYQIYTPLLGVSQKARTDEIADFKKEIRAFKGALLAL